MKRLIQCTISQTRFLLRQKGAITTFFILLAMVLVSFIRNMQLMRGWDVLELYYPAKILLISGEKEVLDGDLSLLFIQFYPILVACPAGFSLAFERSAGIAFLSTSRLGGKQYRISKLMAGMLTTFIVFVLPCLIELVLTCLSLPAGAHGDPFGDGMFSEAYLWNVDQFLFHDLYWISPMLYGVTGILLFGLVSGLLAGISIAISSVMKVRFRALLFLPPFLLLYSTTYLDGLHLVPEQFAWYHYLRIFDISQKNTLYYVVSLMVLLSICIICSWIGGKKDCLD